MPLPLNPYIAGNPVGDSPAFIGRADVLREVSRVLRRLQQNAIVLYGQRRIGKTSVLLQLQAQLRAEGSYRPIYFDLQDKSANSLEQVVLELARSIAHELELAEPNLGDDPDKFFRSDRADRFRWCDLDFPLGCCISLSSDEETKAARRRLGERKSTSDFCQLARCCGVCRMAIGADGRNISIADRGRVGICGTSRNGYCVFVWR